MKRLLLVIAMECTAVAVAHTLSAPYRAVISVAWLTTADLGTLLLATAHLAAWVAMWWLLLSTIHDVILTAAAVRHRGASRRLAVAPRWIRRIVDQAIGTLMVVSLTVGPAGAMAPPASAAPTAHQVVQPPVPIIAGIADVTDPPATPQPVSQSPSTAAPEPAVPSQPAVPMESAVPLQPDVPMEAEVPPQPAAPPEEQPSDDPDVADPTAIVTAPPVPESAAAITTAGHVVAPGENLWVIARATLLRRLDSVPTDQQTHAYWVRLIQANDVASGDPDLIYPGERLALPDLPADMAPEDHTAPEEQSSS